APVKSAPPAQARSAGATPAVLRGHGFRDDDEVRVGGRLAGGAERVNARHLRITTPPGAPGTAAIEVRHADGTTAARDDGFTYEAIDVDPTLGSVAGGTYVTITGLGTDFDGATQVTFDGVPATGLDVENAERLTVYTPPGTPGDANVVVTTAAKSYRADRGYTYMSTGDPFGGGLSGG